MKYEDTQDERVVIELPAMLKRRLYSSLSLDGLTMKDWFREQAESYVEKREAANRKKEK